MRMFETIKDKAARLRSDRRGAIAAIAAITMLGAMGLTAVVVDVGSALVVRTSMQAAADAAALSGAGVLAASGPSGATTTASSYGAQAGSKNASANITVTNASGYPTTRCLTSIGVSCTGTPAANAVVVRQQAAVPTYFTRLFGFDHIDVNVMSTAAIAGGVTKPVEVMLVVDTTGSMNDNDTACGKTKITCALEGARTLMSGMAPSSTKVGLMKFPPMTAASEAAKAYDCSASTNPAVTTYGSATAVYDVLPLGNDFRTSDTSPVVPGGNNLNGNSDVVKAFGGKSGCAGMGALSLPGTYYADIMNQAQTKLATSGASADTQKVIILLSDGDATAVKTATSKWPGGTITAAKYDNQCQQGVDAAAAAKAAGTWVYSVAYGSSSTSGCNSDAGRIRPCAAMSKIASDPSKFFSSASGTGCTSAANPTTALNSIFSAIGQTFRGTRLVPNSTT